MNLDCPIVSAPMAFAGGGALAAAVTRAGGLGLIGGGYGDEAWLTTQFQAAGETPCGVGFITWSLQQKPELLDEALHYKPTAVMLSFGDAKPFAATIQAAGAKLFCQCQNMTHVAQALAAGADVIVAQGGEAGGHGQTRGTMSFVPEVADMVARQAPDTLILAAGGIADGRGLAAALMLGADGVLIGSRLWASQEALVADRHHQALVESNGDSTQRTTVADIARQLTWPEGYTARIRRNEFVAKWHGRETELKESLAHEAPLYKKHMAAGDPDHCGVWYGEAAGLIDAIEPAAKIIADMTTQANKCLRL